MSSRKCSFNRAPGGMLSTPDLDHGRIVCAFRSIDGETWIVNQELFQPMPADRAPDHQRDASAPPPTRRSAAAESLTLVASGRDGSGTRRLPGRHDFTPQARPESSVARLRDAAGAQRHNRVARFRGFEHGCDALLHAFPHNSRRDARRHAICSTSACAVTPSIGASDAA